MFKALKLYLENQAPRVLVGRREPRDPNYNLPTEVHTNYITCFSPRKLFEIHFRKVAFVYYSS